MLKLRMPSLEEIPTACFPTAKTPGPCSDAPPLEVAHLQEEANKALGDLLAIKSSIDTCWQKLVWSLAWLFVKMIPKLWSLSRKQRLSVPIPSRKLRPVAQQPPGRQRLEDPPRLAPFNDHTIKPHFSPPVKPHCKLALTNSAAHW